MQHPTIYQALASVMDDVSHVAKTERNAQQGFMFRGIDAVVQAVAPALRVHGVIVTPRVVSAEYATIEIGSKRTPMGHARVQVEYTFWGPAGDCIVTSAAAEAMDSGDKATAKAMSVAFRTVLLQALALPTGEPDPDSQSYERSHRDTPRAEPVAPQPDPDAEALIAAVASVGSLGQDDLRALWQTHTAHLAVPVMVAGQRTTLRDAIMARKAELDGVAA